MSTIKFIVGNEITSYTNRNINLNIKLDSESYQQMKKQVLIFIELKYNITFNIIVKIFDI